MDKIPMTPQGHRALESELKHLRQEERPAVISAIEEARKHGDLSENAEYHAAKERQAFIEGRIEELENALSRADVIDPKTLTGASIKFGATVTVVDDHTSKEAVYTIVGSFEADLDRGLIAFDSPLARALIGKEAGDFIDVQTPGGLRHYEVLKVLYQ